MDYKKKYSINLEVKFGPLEIIDIPKLIERSTHKWQNISLCTVNNSVVRLAVIEGEFHWHKHNKEDEFFFVIDGLLLIDLEEKLIETISYIDYIIHHNLEKDGIFILDTNLPLHNKTFYESVDTLLGISKQTVNINKKSAKTADFCGVQDITRSHRCG
ncbi:MAG: hypothetical protein ACFFKA_19135 [Candidatus Thorarchaeota archaeon]